MYQLISSVAHIYKVAIMLLAIKLKYSLKSSLSFNENEESRERKVFFVILNQLDLIKCPDNIYIYINMLKF